MAVVYDQNQARTDMAAIVVRMPTAKEMPLVLALRHAVLDPDRNVDSEVELSSKDFDSSFINMAAFVGEQVVSTVRLNPVDPNTYLVRKMATSIGLQGQGIGGRVLMAAEREAIKRGATKVILDSRKAAIPFYERAGYVLTGEETEHGDGILNYTMIKQVSHG